MCVCVRACVRACVRTCACMWVSAHMCVCVCVCDYVTLYSPQYFGGCDVPEVGVVTALGPQTARSPG